MHLNPEGLTYDAVFVAIFAFCTVYAARKGAFRALAGIAGTIAGVVLGSMFQGRFSPTVIRWLRPIVQRVFGGDSLPELTVKIRDFGLPKELQPLLDAAQNAASDAAEAARAALAERLTDFFCEKLAPILAFIGIFLAAKLAVWLVCTLLSMDIPILSTINRILGGLIGGVSGILILLALCWGIWRFAPNFNIPVLSREALAKSMIGSYFCRLFT